MKITDGSQLLQQIDAGERFALDKHGKLETMNILDKIVRYFTDDSKSERGKLRIMEREFAVQTVMTKMLRNDNSLPNLTTRPHQTMPLTWAIRNTIAARTELVNLLEAVPRDARSGIRAAVMERLRHDGMLDDGDVMDVLATVKEHVETFSTPVMLAFFSRVKHVPTPEEQQVIYRIVNDEFLKAFEPKNMQGKVRDSGVYEGYERDAYRDGVHINGTRSTLENQTDILMAAIPRKFLPFVSTALTQEGISVAVAQYVNNMDWETTKLAGPVTFESLLNGSEPVTEDFRMPGYGDLIREDMTPVTYKDPSSVDTTDPDNITIKYSMSMQYEYGSNPRIVMGTHKFDISLNIPTDQDVDDTMVPKHTMTVKMVPVAPLPFREHFGR